MKIGGFGSRVVFAALLLLHLVGSQDVQTDNEEKKSKNLAEQPACLEDAKEMKVVCKKTEEEMANNWVFLDCLDALPDNQSLSSKCETLVWDFKLSVSKQEFFLEQAHEKCGQELGEECKGAASEPGHLLACMVELKGKVASLQCGQFLSQVEKVMFSDWRLISSFMTECRADVNKLECGSSRRKVGQMLSQETTLMCLSRQLGEVSPSCRNEVLTLAELQGEDFHLDRELYLACRKDREAVCSEVQAGQGRVYHCLTEHKDQVSEDCKEQLNRRQVMAAEDYKSDVSLTSACGQELAVLQCGNKEEKEDGVHVAVQLSTVLLCLEAGVREEKVKVGGRCISEMQEIRRSLMEDFSVTPELVTSCKAEIRTHCGRDSAKEEHPGETIHCLMKAAMEEDKRRESKDRSKELTFGRQCEDALNRLLDAAQIASDWKADPVLEDACEDVVFATCDAKQEGDAVMSCLMEQLARGSPAMTKECGEVLMQIHYFLAREVMLDDHLYQACKADAASVCKAPEGWHRGEQHPTNLLVFPCLVRNLYAEDVEEDEEEEKNKSDEVKELLSDACTEEVERTLRQRAVSVQLQPEVEEACRGALHTLCAKATEPGQELECLQQNYQALLDSDCRAVVSRYTQIQAANPYLHPIVTTACGRVIERACGAEDKAHDGAGVMECLIRHKMDHPEKGPGAMNKKCRTVVEHWQIITLQDWRFSASFKQACKHDIREHCVNPRPKKKADVVSCLVMLVSNDTVMENQHRVKKDCRAELKFELLSEHSNLKLDPKLAEACSEDVMRLCLDENQQLPEDGGLECLKAAKHRDIKSKHCKKLLFKEEREEAEDAEVDFALLRGCKREVQQHCSDQPADQLLHCLKDWAGQDSNFDQTCLAVIRKRTVQRMKDYRLNPGLRKSCKQDIPKFCGDLIAGKNRIDSEGGGDFFEGKVIECLKEKVIQKDTQLSSSCHKEVVGLMEEAAPLVAADPILEEMCPKSIERCKLETNGKGDLEIHECLKRLFGKEQLEDGRACSRHLALIIEGAGADINVDPVLHAACSLDLQKFCRDIPQGEGKMLGCLAAAARVSSFTLEPECKVVLDRRLSMYDQALRVAPLETAAELYRSVMESHHRNYFLSFGFFFLCIIFGFGLCFGRVTNRLNGEMKNR